MKNKENKKKDKIDKNNNGKCKLEKDVEVNINFKIQPITAKVFLTVYIDMENPKTKAINRKRLLNNLNRKKY